MTEIASVIYWSALAMAAAVAITVGISIFGTRP